MCRGVPTCRCTTPGIETRFVQWFKRADSQITVWQFVLGTRVLEMSELLAGTELVKPSRGIRSSSSYTCFLTELFAVFSATLSIVSEWQIDSFSLLELCKGVRFYKEIHSSFHSAHWALWSEQEGCLLRVPSAQCADSLLFYWFRAS